MVNKKILALDMETFLISNDWESPKPVCLSWWSNDSLHKGVCDNCGQNLQNQLREVFRLTLEEEYAQVWHNGFGFDLLVIWNYFKELQPQIIECLDKGLIHDTLIRERLYDLSTQGEIRLKRGAYSLAGLVKKYIGRDISALKKGEDIWRLRYGELDNIPLDQYPKEAYDYALQDVEVLSEVFDAQEDLRRERGIGSINTESLQIKSALALNVAYQKGMKVNKERLEILAATLDEKLEPHMKFLLEKGFAHFDKKGKFIKRQKEFIMYLEKHYSQHLKRTFPTKTHPDGQIRTDEEVLGELPPDEIVLCRRDMSILEKYKNTYIAKIRKAGYIFHEKYDILKETGRTSSFIQTMPREGGIREIFESREGFKYAVIDYAHIEADVMAQCYKNLGLGHGLVDYINTGADYHALIGSSWYNAVHGTKLTPMEFSDRRSSGDEECKKFRTLGKPAGLGLSGGIGPDTLRTTAKGQGIDLTIEEAIESLRYAEGSVPGLTSFRGVWRSPEKGWLGSQKPLGQKRFGYYTTKLGKKAPIIEDMYGYEVNGRWRNNCTYCSLANGISMQGPAADGAKEAIWDCFKYCWESNYLSGHDICHMLFFVHDEIGFEVKEEFADVFITQACNHMCRGMQKILPDIRVTVEAGLYDRWTKDASQAEVLFKAWVTPEGDFFHE